MNYLIVHSQQTWAIPRDLGATWPLRAALSRRWDLSLSRAMWICHGAQMPQDGGVLPQSEDCLQAKVLVPGHRLADSTSGARKCVCDSNSVDYSSS